MSTNIQEGFCFKDGLSMYEINKCLTKIKPALLERARHAYFDVMSEGVVMWALKHFYGITANYALLSVHHSDTEGYEGTNLLHLTWYMYEQYQKRIRKMRSNNPYNFCPELSLECQIFLFPLEDKVLGWLWWKGPAAWEVYEHICSQPWAKEYGYWDCTDPDENISPEEWQQREQDWEKALPGIGIIKEHGLMREMVNILDATRGIAPIEHIEAWILKNADYIQMDLAQQEVDIQELIQKIKDYNEEGSNEH